MTTQDESRLMGSSLSSEVRSITTGGFWTLATNTQVCSLKTRRVITNPQLHLAKSRLNSGSESPGCAQESSRRSRSNTVSMFLAGRSYVAIDVKSPSMVDTIWMKLDKRVKNLHLPSDLLDGDGTTGNTHVEPAFCVGINRTGSGVWAPTAKEILSFVTKTSFVNLSLRRTGYRRKSKPLLGYKRSKYTVRVTQKYTKIINVKIDLLKYPQWFDAHPATYSPE